MNAEKKISSFIAKRQQELVSACESLNSYTAYIAFLEQSIQDYVEKGTEEFFTTFVEFGETFTTEYNVAGILTGMGGYKTTKAVADQAITKSRESYQDLLYAQHYKILALIACFKERKIAPSVFSAEIASLLILAAIYFPEHLALVADYFAFYLKEEEALMNKNVYASLLGKTDLIPLSVFVANESAMYDLPASVKKYGSNIQPAYQQAMAQLYSEDETVVSAWINELAAYHIANSKDDWTLPFNHTIWQYFPLEIIALLELRARKGCRNNFINHPLLAAWQPYIHTDIPLAPDDFTKRLIERIKGNDDKR